MERDVSVKLPVPKIIWDAEWKADIFESITSFISYCSIQTQSHVFTWFATENLGTTDSFRLSSLDVNTTVSSSVQKSTWMKDLIFWPWILDTWHMLDRVRSHCPLCTDCCLVWSRPLFATSFSLPQSVACDQIPIRQDARFTLSIRSYLENGIATEENGLLIPPVGILLGMQWPWCLLLANLEMKTSRYQDFLGSKSWQGDITFAIT